MSGEVQIAVYTDLTEAEIAKGLLTSNGVPCILTEDDAGGMYPQLHQGLGVRLVVPEEFAEQAKEMLDSAVQDAKDAEKEDPDEDQ